MNRKITDFTVSDRRAVLVEYPSFHDGRYVPQVVQKLDPNKTYRIVVEEVVPPVKKWRWVYLTLQGKLCITLNHYADQADYHKRVPAYKGKDKLLQRIDSTEKEFDEQDGASS